MIILNNEQERTDFVRYARYCVDRVPFKHMGRTLRGLDCAGLIIYALAKMDHKIEDLKSYGREPFRDGLEASCRANLGEPINDQFLVPGDILLMKFEKEPHHLAIVGDYVLGGLSLIHSYGSIGKVVEHRFDSDWRAKISFAFHMKTR